MSITRRAILCPLLALLVCIASGCEIVGVAAYKLIPPPTIQPKYTNLAGQSIGIMVWTDRAVRIDWPTIQIDMANAIEAKFKAQTKDDKGKDVAKQLSGATFPVQPASILRYQRDYPETEAMPITDVAPKFGVTRLIYIELDDFSTRAEQAVELFRGNARATVRVIEITDGKGKVAFEQGDVIASWPPKSTKEGVPNAGDFKTYVGTIDAFATQVVNLFVPWQQEDW